MCVFSSAFKHDRHACGSFFTRAAPLFFIALALAALPLVAATGERECTSLSIRSRISDASLTRRLTAMLATRIQERSGVVSAVSKPSTCSVELDLRSGIGAQGFQVEDVSTSQVRITGNDQLGLLYGIGKFLHTSLYHDGSLTLSRWHGTSVPEKSFRGIYFATHFFNYYHQAPIKDVQRYVEDLALWGYNTVIVWFDMHQYTGIQDPAAQAMIARLNALLHTAKEAGLQTGVTLIANEAYANSPVAMRADWTAGHDGYFREPKGHYHVELCPYKPGAQNLLLKWREEVFQAFKNANFDYIIVWPYDQGGCTSKECAPWGSNGFLKIAPPVANLARRDFPNCKVILSTWYFDKFTHGEWDGLEKKFSVRRPVWLNYLMADDAGVKRYSSASSPRHTPGGLPLLSFPEISMWGATPWGGFGANPLPAHHQQIWDVGKNNLDGGMPYSEGIFEDLNKVLYARFFWARDTTAASVLDEYIAYEFSPKVVPLVHRAVSILEPNYPRHTENLDNLGQPVRFVMDHTANAAEAFKLLQDADAKLPARAKESWRWRILYLRGKIDAGLVRNNFRTSPEVEKSFQELTRIYHAQDAIYAVAPPTSEVIQRYRTEGDGSTGESSRSHRN